MAGKKQVLFYINETRRDRISCDDLQWILERGNPASARPGRDSDYRGISFVCTRKEILYRVIDEMCAVPSTEACALLAALPDEFTECRALLDRLGIGEFRAWLQRQARIRRGRRDALRRREGHRLRRDHRTRFSDAGRPSQEAVRALRRGAS